MSTIFLDFSDSMLKSEAIRQDHEVGQKLLIATSEIVSLAKTAAHDPEDVPEASSTNNVSPSAVPRSDTQPQVPTTFPTSQDVGLSPTFTTQFPIPEHFNPVPDTLLRKQIFGNGWFGLQPEALSQLSFGKADMSRLDNSLGVRLIQTTLVVAYEYLMDTTGASDGLAREIYRFALLYHTREELLFNIRWFLGPGFRALRALGRAVFGFSSSLSLQYLNAVSSGLEPKILNPLVDAQALVEAQKERPVVRYMNAFDIEDYLISKGAFHIDQDIVQIRKPHYLEVGPASSRGNSSPESLMIQPTHGLEEALSYRPSGLSLPESDFLAGSIFPSNLDNASMEPPIVEPLGGVWGGIFSFDDVVEGSDSSSHRAEPTPQPALVPNQVYTLSVPIFFQNLAKKAQCLGTGPGYPEKAVDMAIDLSTVDCLPY